MFKLNSYFITLIFILFILSLITSFLTNLCCPLINSITQMNLNNSFYHTPSNIPHIKIPPTLTSYSPHLTSLLHFPSHSYNLYNNNISFISYIIIFIYFLLIILSNLINDSYYSPPAYYYSAQIMSLLIHYL